MSNHLFKICKHPTKQNPNIWSSPGKLSYRGLFISTNLFISVLDKTLDAFKKSLKHIVLCDIWSIFHRQLTDTPPTFKDYRIDRVSTAILVKCWPIVVWYVSQQVTWYIGRYIVQHIGCVSVNILTDMSIKCWLICRSPRYFDQGVHKLCKILVSRGVCSIHLTGWPTDKLTNWLFVWLIFWLTKGS